jgi:hypothetical protein
MRFLVMNIFLLLISAGFAQSAKDIRGALMVNPNPSSELFSVSYQSGLTRPVTLRVFDATGQLVFSRFYRNFNGELKENLDLGNQAKGIYFLQVSSDRQSDTQRLVLE